MPSYLKLPLIAVLVAGIYACAEFPRARVDGPVVAGPLPVRVDNGVFVGPNGMTLYTFDKDPLGRSVCYAKCAADWPPLMVTGGPPPTPEWTIVTRDDGGRQWAYRGKPLYYWVKDARPGDRTGDGVGNAWRLARIG
jgi:predicted lipoprotein with Yx(FWY)xxD motif